MYVKALKVHIDGSTGKTVARYINHACDCESNCAVIVDPDTKRIWITAKKNIIEGAELCWDYGYRWNTADADNDTMSLMKTYQTITHPTCS